MIFFHPTERETFNTLLAKITTEVWQIKIRYRYIKLKWIIHIGVNKNHYQKYEPCRELRAIGPMTLILWI